MTAERNNTKYSLPTAKNLSDYDRSIRNKVTRRPKYLDDAIKYIKSKGAEPEVEAALIKKLQAYPSNVIDKMFPQLDRMLLRTEIEIHADKNQIYEKAKNLPIEHVPSTDVNDLYESLDVGEPTPEVDEVELVQKDEKEITEKLETEEFQPDPSEEQF